MPSQCLPINLYISQLVRQLTRTVFSQLILWSGHTVVNLLHLQ